MFACPDCKFSSEWWDALLEHYYWTHGTQYPGKKKKAEKKQNKNSEDK